MKKTFVFVLLLATAFSCVRHDLLPPDEDVTNQPPLTAGSVVLALQKPVKVSDLQVNLLEVNENRCPENVTCFWYGYAAATLELKNNAGASVNQQMYLGGPLPAPNNRGFREADTVVVQLSGKQYQLILSKVLPFPNTSLNQKPEDKKVTVGVLPL